MSQCEPGLIKGPVVGVKGPGISVKDPRLRGKRALGPIEKAQIHVVRTMVVREALLRFLSLGP